MSPERATSVSVCFPAYQEEATVGPAIEEAFALLEESKLDWEIIACDDGSTDRTGEILDRLALGRPRLEVLRNERNLGIRATFERLYGAASHDWVFLNSVDRQWPTAVLFDLIERSDRADIIIAARSRKPYGPLRALVSWAFNSLPRVLFGVETHDAGAVKLVRREIIERFTLVSRSPFNEAERMIRARRAGYEIDRIEVEVAPRRHGEARGVSLANLASAVADLWRVWWSLRSSSGQGAGPSE